MIEQGTSLGVTTPNVEAAQAMLDALMSVGTETLGLTYIDLGGAKVGYRAAVPPKALREQLANVLHSSRRDRYNVIVRPAAPASRLLQLDDLGPGAVERVRAAPFLILETSPGNFQAWLALPPAEIDPELARRLREGVGADPNASGAARLAGSLNYKEKYAPDFPQVRCVHSAPGLVTSRAQLEALGVVAVPPEPNLLDAVVTVGRKPRKWPSYQLCLEGAQMNHDGTGPDRSRVDFTWCITAIRWGFAVEDVANRLMELSEKAQENGEDYAWRTAENAAAEAARQPRVGRGA